jgi:chemotaxis protein MotB
MAATTQPRVFKKVEVIEGGGHHGGGWKVAYADFMTAMMAFFLLMWILSSADEQKLRGIAEYFTNATLPGGSGVLDGATLGPPGTLTASNGAIVARGSELGKIDDPASAKWEIRDETATSVPDETQIGSEDGAHENPAAANVASASQAASDGSKSAGDATIDNVHALDNEKFKKLEQDILQAMQENPDLDPLQKNLIFQQTPEGLQIQIIDQEGQPMFYSGRAEMQGATDQLLANLGKSLARLPNKITLSGHTDAVRFANSQKYDNWDLSSDRANVTRRVFEASGVARDRIIRVSGLADTAPLVPENPTDASNRRITVSVQYQKVEDYAGDDVAPTQIDAATPPAETGEKLYKASIPAPVAPQNSGEVQRVAQNVDPVAAPLKDDVFLNLRNALR